MNSAEQQAIWLARQQIAELQQGYAFATDLIGRGDDDSVARGREIYHRVFTADAQIGAAGVEPQIGPDAWVALVKGALAAYKSTQHLIGTQQVDITQLPDAQGAGGKASMTSYLQAWHAHPNDEMWLFVGSYHATAVHTPDKGWQMSGMLLEQTSEDYRTLHQRPA